MTRVNSDVFVLCIFLNFNSIFFSTFTILVIYFVLVYFCFELDMTERGFRKRKKKTEPNLQHQIIVKN